MVIDTALGMILRVMLGVLVLLVEPIAALANGSDRLVDPTQPYSTTSGAIGSHRTGLVLQSTSVSPLRRVAVINGQELSVGERIDGAEVVDIRPYEVIMSRAGRQTTLRLLPRILPRDNPEDRANAGRP